MPRKKKEEPEKLEEQNSKSATKKTSAAANAPEPAGELDDALVAKQARRRRLKKEEEPAAEAAPAPEEKEEKPKTRRAAPRRKKAEEPKAEEPVAAEPAKEEEKPKRRSTRSRAKKTEEKPVEEPVKEEPKAEEEKPKTRRTSSRRKKAEEPKAEEAAPEAEAPQAEEEEKPKSRRRSGRGRRKAQPEPEVAAEAPEEEEEFSEPQEDEFGMPIPAWRPRKEDTRPRARAAKPEPAAEPEQKESRRRGRRSDREKEPEAESREDSRRGSREPREPREERAPRERGERRERPERSERSERSERPARQPKEAVKKEEPKEPLFRREPVTIPPEAAQVVLKDGLPSLVHHRRLLAPLLFMASAPDERRLATVLEQVKMAAENGIHLFSILTEMEVSRDSLNETAGYAAYLIRKIVQEDPEARIILRLVFVAPQGWQRTYSSAAYKAANGEEVEPSLSDDVFWSEAETCMNAVIRALQKLPEGKRIAGVHLERGEWFCTAEQGYDTSKAAEAKFRDWLRHRYRNDVVSLRAAWFDGSADFDTVVIPEQDSSKHEALEPFVRTGRKSRRWVDYHLFLSDSAVERIARLANAVKKTSEGLFAVGVSYGYTFEWSHPASGHLSLGKLLRCPDIDYIAGPPSYRNREPGGTAPVPCPVDSFALNGKLYISEEDYKTPISGRTEPDEFNPVMKTPQALESVHWRGAGGALAHSAGVCWMDTWGNGWLNSEGIWQRAGKIQQAMMWRVNQAEAEPEVAVLIDERSLAYLADEQAFDALVQNVREAVLRSGLSVGFYLLSDLAHRENFPDARLYVFVNAWDIRPEVRSAIKSRLQKDDKVLFWLYAAGIFEGGRESLERVREATGIPLRPQPFNSKTGTTLLSTKDRLASTLPRELMAEGGKLEPSYFAIPEESTIVLGEYTNTGLPSFVMHEFTGEKGEAWKSVFLGEPVVTPALFRALGEMAGAHVWNYEDDVVHARPPFVTIHSTGTGMRAITLPDKWAAYSITTGQWTPVENNTIRFVAMEGTTHVFLVGHKTEIEAILQSHPVIELTDEEIKERSDDTVHWDAIQFDVPIMKLDEWVEETWSETLAEDLLLKPSLIETEQESEAEESNGEGERSGSRGRRRRRRRKYSGQARDDRDSGPKASDSDGIGVLFRKRE